MIGPAIDLNDKKLLIIRLSSLGDVILTLPTVKALKDCYPRAYLAWLIQDSFAEVLMGNPYIDEIIPVNMRSVTDKYATPGVWLDGGWRMLRSLASVSRLFRDRQFDVVLEFQALFKSAVFAGLNRGAERYGFKNGREFSWVFLNRAAFIRDKSRHAVENYLQFARHFGCEPDTVEFPIVLHTSEETYVEKILRNEGVQPGDFLVFIAATARWESKFWEAEAFARVADELVRRYGARIIFSGLPSEAAYYEGITDLMKEPAVIMAGKTTIRQFLALIKRCSLYVGVDSGAMHAAVAFGLPVVALFGPAIRTWVSPYGQPQGIVGLDLPCAPCNKKRCKDKACMRGITPDMVLDKIAEVLDRSKDKIHG